MQPLPQALGSPRGRGGSGSPSSPFVLVLVAQAQSTHPQCWKPWSTSNKLLPKFGLLSNRHGLFGWRTGALSAGRHWSCWMMLTRSQKWCLSVNQVVCVDRGPKVMLISQSRSLARSQCYLLRHLPASKQAIPALWPPDLLLPQHCWCLVWLLPEQVIWDCEIRFLKARVKQVALGDQTPWVVNQSSLFRHSYG